MPSNSSNHTVHQLPFVIFLVVTALICGALVMVIEVLGSRIINPFFGASLFVWTSLITVTLVGLALGYCTGGVLSDWRGDPSYLYGIIFLAGIAVLLIPVLRKPVLENTLSLGLRLGALTASSLLIGPAIFLLGCVSPYIIKIAAREIRNIGRTVGLLYAVSTLGSLIGTICTGFILIAYFSINQIFAFVGGSLIVLSSLYFVFFKKKPIALLVLIVPFLLPASRDIRTKLLENGTVITKVCDIETFYGNIKVLDYRYPDKNIRELLVDGAVSGTIDLDNGLPLYGYFYYLQYIPYSLNPRGQRCLAIGLGAGIIPRWYEKMGIMTDVVDINPEIFAVAEKYFGFHTTGEKIVEDVRYFLNRSKKKYDYIIFDVFNGENTPFHVLSRESLQLISQRLNHGGILGINLVGSIKAETFVMASVIKTLQQVFTTVEIYPTFDPDKQKWPMGNLEIIAYNSPPLTLATARLKTWRFHPEAATARDNLGKKFAFPPETPGVIITDNYNPLDFYDLKVREGYRQWLLSRPNLELLL